MTKKDKKAYYDYREMEGLKDLGLNLFEIANLMKREVSYLLSLEAYFD